MSVIEVERPGLLTTIQDLGRPGYGPMGVSAAGAADPISLRLGNRLLGNPEGAPALEITLRGGTFRFPDGAVIALCGAPFECSVPLWRSVDVAPGQSIDVAGTRDGARLYLCVRGGIDSPKVLGSASTHVVSRLGGAVLHAGHTLHIGAAPASPAHRRVRRSVLDILTPRKTLRITPGPQRGRFSSDIALLDFEVTGSSNRTGIRLAGPSLNAAEDEMLTEGVSLGAIQVPSSGHPIILFVDAQTTGGYPIVANVIAADLPSLGQLRPHDRIRFEWTTIEAARGYFLEQEQLLSSADLLW